MCWRRMRRRGEWQAKKWRELENRNWKMGRGWRHAIGRAVFIFWGERREEFNAEFAEDAEGAEKRRAERLWRWIVRAHPYKPRVGHPQGHLLGAVTDDRRTQA